MSGPKKKKSSNPSFPEKYYIIKQNQNIYLTLKVKCLDDFFFHVGIEHFFVFVFLMKKKALVAKVNFFGFI